MNAGMFLSGVGACFHKHGITVKYAKPMDIRVHTNVRTTITHW